MKSRRLIVLSLALSGICGCSGSPKEKAAPQPAVSVDKPVTSPGESAAATASAKDDATISRDAVVARTLKYAEEMDKAIAQKKASAAQPATAAAAAEAPTEQPVPAKVAAKPEPSKVDWATMLASVPQEPATPAAAPSPAPVAKPVAATPVAPAMPVAPNQAQAAPIAATGAESPASTANAKIALDGADTGPIIIPEGTEIGTGEPVAAATPKALPKAPEDIALAEQLAKRVKENPLDVSAHLDYQLHQFTIGQSVPQLAPLAPLPTEDREVIAAVMDGLSNFRTSVQNDNNQLLSKKIRPLVDLSDRLKAQADLAVPTIALCRRVDGFGVYEPIEPAEFPRGRETPVILYCEVANFSSQRPGGKRWETTLAHSATLYKENGVPVWSDKSTNVTDNSRNRRHDFFVVKMLKLPSTLTAGKYVLKVTVMDRQTNRMAEGSTTLTIGGGNGEGVAKTE